MKVATRPLSGWYTASDKNYVETHGCLLGSNKPISWAKCCTRRLVWASTMSIFQSIITLWSIVRIYWGLPSNKLENRLQVQYHEMVERLVWITTSPLVLVFNTSWSALPFSMVLVAFFGLDPYSEQHHLEVRQQAQLYWQPDPGLALACCNVVQLRSQELSTFWPCPRPGYAVGEILLLHNSLS